MNRELIDLSSRIIQSVRHQSYHDASLIIREFTNALSSSSEITSLLSDSSDDISFIFTDLTTALSKEDYILFADILEESFIPWLKSYFVYEEPVIYGDYSIEPSSSGFPTAKYLPRDFYLHSNCNPVDEARQLINQYFNDNCSEYAVYGLGLGYHIKALVDASMNAYIIYVYESDESLIEYVKLNDIYNLFNTPSVHILYDPLAEKFSEKISNHNIGVLFHYPSIKKINNSSLKMSVKRLYCSWNSFEQWKHMIQINFNKNILNCTHNIQDEASRFYNKNVYIIGGGPSVDYNLELLSNLDKTNNIIICATTILKKLLLSGITPDYAIVMDAQERTYGHMIGIENCSVPLIIDSAANWKFAQNHSASTFLALQQGYPPAEEYAKTHNCPLFETGGTVITLALDIAIQFTANSIYFIGVDLSFPNKRTHAQGTMDEKTINNENLIDITDIHGNTVKTDELMYSYLLNIEDLIASHPNINYYNLSPFGANIKGCININ